VVFVLPETGPTSLVRRTPGETDLRVFTAVVIPAGRHRVDPRRPGLRVVHNRRTGRPVLRTALALDQPDDLPAALDLWTSR
jgi:hypothetical protein